MKAGPVKQIQDERGKLITWLQENDRYEFLWDEGDTLHRLRCIKDITEILDTILEEAKGKILPLGNKFRTVGFGDTATDEAIVGELYRLIHAQWDEVESLLSKELRYIIQKRRANSSPKLKI